MAKNTRIRKCISMFLILVMVLQYVPLTALAVDGEALPDHPEHEESLYVDSGAERQSDCTHPEMDENGFCTACDNGYESAVVNQDGYYEIGNAGQLFRFAEKVNAGETGINAILTDNIVVNENLMDNLTIAEDGTAIVNEGESVRSWTPIASDGWWYSGTFDGNGKSVSGLYFNDSSVDYVGLIGDLGYDGAVKNVTVADGYFCGNYYVGGVAGNSILSDVTNCVGNSHVLGMSQVGGVVGYATDATIENCRNNGTVTAVDLVAGGVLDSANNVIVNNCFNTGKITCDSNCGGVVGSAFYTDITNCYNTGTVTGESYVAAIVGEYMTDSILTNCYYLDTCGAAGEGTAMTEAQFASGEVTWLLNGSTDQGELVWKQTIGTDAVPMFQGAIVSYDSENDIYYNVVPHEHAYEAVFTAPTCTEAGYTTYACATCSDSYTVEIPALGHSFGEWVETKAPTCTEPGLTDGEMCFVCREMVVPQEEIPALGHSYEAVVTEPVGCNGGYTTYTCTVCNYSYIGDETEPLGHTYEVAVTEPTCTSYGYVIYTCTGCGDRYTAEVLEPKATTKRLL